jgi:2-phospho-L-lactate guanylyltransferase (CobY/MobA/RfbA family)
MRPPGAFATCFGTPQSAAGHERIAWSAGGDAYTLDLPGLAFDLDTPEDLAAWRRA